MFGFIPDFITNADKKTIIYNYYVKTNKVAISNITCEFQFFLA